MVTEIDPVLARLSTPLPQATNSSPEVLGKEDFLRLLVAQMEHQDPLNPQDPTEFTAQLTQFSNLEQLITVNKTLSSMTELQQLASSVSAASFIGKAAVVEGQSILVSQGSPSPVQFELASPAEQNYLNVYDETGNLIYRENLGSLGSGLHRVQWNGLDDQGHLVPDGNYRYGIEAINGDQSVGVTTRVTGVVTGVSYENGNVMLRVGESLYSLGEIVSIEQAPQPAPTA